MKGAHIPFEGEVDKGGEVENKLYRSKVG